MNHSKIIMIVFYAVASLQAMERPAGTKIMSTALMQWAAVGKCKQMRKILQTDKTIIDAADSAGNTALIYATVFGQSEAVQLLLNEGATVTKKNREEVTALEMSVLTNIPRITRMLLVDDLQLLKQTLGQALVTGKNPERVYKNPLNQDQKKRKSLATIKKNNREIIECLQLKIATLDTSASSRFSFDKDIDISPLIRATLEGDEDKVQALLKKQEHVKTIDLQDSCGRTALHYAAILQKITIAKLLIDAGAQRTIEDQDSCTPLNHTILQGNVPLSLLLLNAGVDINQQVATGHTPLNMAVTQNNPELVEAILEHNPDKTLPCKNGLTPYASGQAIMKLQLYGITKAINDRSQEQLQYSLKELEKADSIRRMLCSPALEVRQQPTPALIGKAIIDVEKAKN